MSVAYSVRHLLLAGSVLAGSLFAGPMSAPSRASPIQDHTSFEILTSTVPLSELAPVPLSAADEQIHREVDQEICTAYRRWRALPGSSPREHIELWCPTGN